LFDRRVGSERCRSSLYANIIVQQLLVSGGVVFAACVKASNTHFDSDIALLASFVTAVDNSSNSTIFFATFCPFSCG